MAKKTLFYCTQCGNETLRWQGQCPACGAWNTIVEQPAQDEKRRGQGRGAAQSAGRPQPPRADEQVIQRDVGRAGHSNERQRAAGVAQPAEDGA